MVDLDAFERMLIRAGAAGAPLTYGEVLRRFGRRPASANVARLCRDLGEVCRRVEARGGPDLACLLVRRSDGLPGEGFFTALRAAGRYDGPSTGPQARKLIERLQAEAFAWCRAEQFRNGVLPAEIDFLVG